VRGGVEDGLRRPLLDDAPRLHDADAIGDAAAFAGEEADGTPLDSQSDAAAEHNSQHHAHSGRGSGSGADDSGRFDDDPLGFGSQRMSDPDEDPPEPLNEMSQLRLKLSEAEARAAENWDRLLRLQAEMENQRKRAQNDVTKARKFALEGIVSDLLPVKDSLEMGLAAAREEGADTAAIIEGADLTLKMLAQVFEKNNIVELNPVDEKFDPEFHQAMSMQEIEGKASNTVATVMQKGYTLNDRLVRPALVMVAK
jgi:molecular chaperone GrpE